MPFLHELPRPGADPAPASPKPASAAVCHFLAKLSFAGVVLMFVVLLGTGGLEVTDLYLLAGGAMGGVIWWVIGDLVENTAKRSE